MCPKRAGVTIKGLSLSGIRVNSLSERSGLFTASQEQVGQVGEGQEDEGRVSSTQAETAPANRPPPPARSSSCVFTVEISPTCSVREAVARFLPFLWHFVNAPIIEWIIM